MRGSYSVNFINHRATESRVGRIVLTRFYRSSLGQSPVMENAFSWNIVSSRI